MPFCSELHSQQKMPDIHWEYYEELTSTNDRAQEIRKKMIYSQLPVAVVAERQTAGRGRYGKSWHTGEGAIAVSVLLEISREFLPALSLLTAQCIVETIKPILGAEFNVSVRLPNDVLVNGKKIAGVLIESPDAKSAIIGVGINVNNSALDIPDEMLNQPITSICDEIGRCVDLDSVLEQFVMRLIDKIGCC